VSSVSVQRAHTYWLQASKAVIVPKRIVWSGERVPTVPEIQLSSLE
jgi:hypothetical protein